MPEIFSIFKSKKEIKNILISAGIFFVISLISIIMDFFIQNVLIIRPEGALPPVLGLYLGPSGALGVALGNLLIDIGKKNISVLCIILNFCLYFFYAYVPYKLWYTFKIKEKCDIPNLNNVKSIIRYIYIIFIDSATVMIISKLSYSVIQKVPFNIEFIILNFFNNYNVQVILGMLILIILSTTDIKPHIPKMKSNLMKNINYEYILYLMMILSILAIFIHKNSYINNKYTVDVCLLIIYILLFIFIFTPIINKVSIVEISKMKGIFSIKGKITAGLLIFGIVFIIILTIVAYVSIMSVTHLPIITNVDENIMKYKKIYIAIEMFGYLVFAITLLVLRYVENKITTPIQILFNMVEEFTKIKHDDAECLTKLKEKCNSINTGNEIEELAVAFEKMMNEIQNHVKNLSEVTVKIQKESAELAVAKKIQSAILPHSSQVFPKRNDFNIVASMTPAKEVGGDFYDFFLIDEDKLAFAIADVSGKGVPAALFMMISKTIIKNLLKSSSHIEEVVEKINNQLCENNETFMFVTSFLGIVDLKTGQMTYVNAGHNPPLIKKENGKFDYVDVKKNCILAIMPNVEFEKQEIQLEEGDILFAYTDGVTEAMNTEGNLYGISRLKDVLNKSYNGNDNIYDIIPIVEKSISEYCSGEDQTDDITMLAFKYIGRKR